MNEKLVCQRNMCTGCNACIAICKKNAITIVDNGLSLNAVIDSSICINCKACEKVCQQNSTPVLQSPIEWHQGWSNDEEIRISSSSGGFATCAAYYALDNSYSVYACSFFEGKFLYRKVNSKGDFTVFAGSKYVKSDTSKVFAEIKNDLASGNKVLFIGLPCHVQGLKLFITPKFMDNLITIDLICHGTPSIKLYREYLKEKKINLNNINHVSFRLKKLYSHLDKKADYEYWLAPFLKGLTYTENCYSCQYAQISRTSDITIGDSWGSSLGMEEKNKGISFILCNTEKGQTFAKCLDFHFENTDLEQAKESNGQLTHPSAKPQQRALFENTWSLTNQYHKAIRKCYPKDIFSSKISSTFMGSFLKSIKNKVVPSHESVQIEFVEAMTQMKDDNITGDKK